MYRNLYIGCFFIKIIAVEFGEIFKVEFRKSQNYGAFKL